MKRRAIRFFYIDSRLNFHSIAYKIHINLRVGVQFRIFILYILYVEDFNSFENLPE